LRGRGKPPRWGKLVARADYQAAQWLLRSTLG
jgi:hypothetical protein